MNDDTEYVFPGVTPEEYNTITRQAALRAFVRSRPATIFYSVQFGERLKLACGEENFLSVGDNAGDLEVNYHSSLSLSKDAVVKLRDMLDQSLRKWND